MTLLRAGDIAEPSGWLRASLVAGVMLLPVDYLMPTADLFREAGAKPSIIAFTGAAFISWSHRRRSGRPLASAGPQWPWLLLLWAGSFAFFVNLLIGWSDFERAKNPVFQFLSQMSLLALFSWVTLELSDVFRSPEARQFAMRLFLPVALVHLAFWSLEATNILTDDPGTFLGMFRSDEGLIERPTGLTSEPSYFGVFAGMFGFNLLFQESRGWVARFILPALLVSTALWINAKTTVVVIGIQLLGLLWLSRNRISLPIRIAILLASAGAVVFYVTSMATFDLEENLSSVMRIGSTLMGLNVASDGHGLLGIGTGQFHFFFRQDYAPDFMLLSQEALNQMDPSAPGRASTYNLFVRLLVEGGVASLLAFLYIMKCALQYGAAAADEHGRFAFLLILGSVGFLMTQDTYFYPPMCLGLAIALSRAPGRSTTP